MVANNGFSFPSVEEREREEVERVVRTFSGENRGVHGPNIIDFNKGRACGATPPERPDRLKPVSYFLDRDGGDEYKERSRFPILCRSFHLMFIPRSSLLFFLSISFYSDVLYHLRAYPKRTQHPLLNAALLSDKARKGSICLASVCSIVDFFSLSTSFRSLLSTTSESSAIFSAKLCFPPRFFRILFFDFESKRTTRKLSFLRYKTSTKFAKDVPFHKDFYYKCLSKRDLRYALHKRIS